MAKSFQPARSGKRRAGCGLATKSLSARLPGLRIQTTNRERRGEDPSEHVEAVRFMRVVKLHESAHPDLRYLFAVPNGGLRDKVVASKMKLEGVRAGILDYCWPMRTTGFPGLFLELKTMTGRASDDQRKFASWARSQGYRCEFAHGWVEAWRVVCEYAGIPFKVV